MGVAVDMECRVCGKMMFFLVPEDAYPLDPNAVAYCGEHKQPDANGALGVLRPIESEPKE